MILAFYDEIVRPPARGKSLDGAAQIQYDKLFGMTETLSFSKDKSRLRIVIVPIDFRSARAGPSALVCVSK